MHNEGGARLLQLRSAQAPAGMTLYFLNLEYETVEIVEFGIFGGCAVVEGRKGNVRTAKRQGHR